MASLRKGKPRIWVTWLTKLLGGNECVWSAWFKAHYRYDKFEEMAGDLAEWNRQHTALMARRRHELEADGWTITVEQQNDFELEGERAIVAGKPDLIAKKDGRVLVVDGKTGRQRESDIWQVLFYLFAFQKARPDMAGTLEGEIHYLKDDERISVTPEELDADRLDRMVALIKLVADHEPPARRPSRYECQRCNIGSRDCPDRVTQAATTAVGEF